MDQKFTHEPSVVIDQYADEDIHKLSVPEVNVVKWPAKLSTTPGINVAWPTQDQDYFDSIKPALQLIVQKLAVDDSQSRAHSQKFMELCYQNQVSLSDLAWRSRYDLDQMALAGYDSPQILDRSMAMLPLSFHVLNETGRPRRYSVRPLLALERLFTFLHSLVMNDQLAVHKPLIHQILGEAVTRFLYECESKRIIAGFRVSVVSNDLHISVRPLLTDKPIDWTVPILRVAHNGRKYIVVNGFEPRGPDVNRALLVAYPLLSNIVLFDRPESSFRDRSFSL